MAANSKSQDAAATPQPLAWQPLTPHGIAAFARAGYGRTLAVLMVFGLAMGMVMMWFVRNAWFPPLAQAVRALPINGEIADGKLSGFPLQPVPLAGNRFLSLTVDLQHTGAQTPPADVQIEFGLTRARFRGVLGYVEAPYPPGLVLPFNQREAVPWWGAWNQAILAGVWVGGTLGLLVIWAVLALFYIPLARVTAWLRGAELSVGAAWRLCAAALMPGAVLMTAALGAYGWGLIDLLRLGIIAVFHIMVAWVYVPLSVCCLPRAQGARQPGTNPFARQG